MIPWLKPAPEEDWFPDCSSAMHEPNGLLAAGGDLSPRRLLAAYRRGIFPWYEAGQPILWWSPDPRTILLPGSMHISRRLRRRLRSESFEVSVDQDFAAVVTACANRGVTSESAGMRDGETGTWITPEMVSGYTRLHRLDHAHSLEILRQGDLVGGIYGVTLGRVFFAESMFSGVTDASKIALACLSGLLQRHRYAMIDCQLPSAHLTSLGCVEIPRVEFTRRIEKYCTDSPSPMQWRQAAMPVATLCQRCDSV